MKFLPTTREEMLKLGWEVCDVIFISGDSYIDTPYNGVALLGKMLVKAGFRVGVIAQPDYKGTVDIERLGEPLLFWGVSAGSIDSMVANYTAMKKKRKQDDFTPGGENNRRPDRATITYTNLIRFRFKNTVPIILGGIEASLRRVVHYDFWTDRLRRSVLFDAKADGLVYGMGEKSVLEIAKKRQANLPWQDTAGVCYIAKEPVQNYLELPSLETVQADKKAFIDMFGIFYQNMDPLNAKGLYQKHDNRYLIQNPPANWLTSEEFDEVHEYDYRLEQHPFYENQGSVRALDTIRFSLNSQRGCYGECNFCAITVHQGRRVVSRSEESLVREAQSFLEHRKFRGIINDVGGPTANMYGYECDKKLKKGVCKTKNCVFPTRCSLLKPDHSPQIRLLKRLRSLEGVKKVFVSSGLRYDLVLEDERFGEEYMKELVSHHVSGQLKIAPEHTQDSVLMVMGKPSASRLESFCSLFYDLNKKTGKNQFLTYYFIAAHPGCSLEDMKKLRGYATKILKTNPEQIQIFTPTPSTWSSVMYYTELDFRTNESIFVEKTPENKEKQKNIMF